MPTATAMRHTRADKPQPATLADVLFELRAVRAALEAHNGQAVVEDGLISWQEVNQALCAKLGREVSRPTVDKFLNNANIPALLERLYRRCDVEKALGAGRKF